MTPEQHEGLGHQPVLPSQKPTCNLQLAPPYLRFSIYSSTSLGSTNWKSRSTTVFTTGKNPHLSGPTQFKPVLFKGQTYIQTNTDTHER